MPKHFPNINPTLTVVGQDALTSIGQRYLYVVNRLGDEIRETTPDGGVIVHRPVAAKVLIDFGMINDEALLTIVADRLADRAAGEYGNRRVESAARMIRKALEAVRVDSTKPLRKRPLGEPVVVEDEEPIPDQFNAGPIAPATPSPIQIPGVIAGATTSA